MGRNLRGACALALMVALIGAQALAIPLANEKSYTPQQAEYVRTLDALLAAKDYKGLQQHVLDPSDPALVLPILDWGRARTLEGKSILVPLLYAQLLWHVGESSPQTAFLKETSVAVTLYSLLVAQADGVKCADKTAPVHRVEVILREYKQPLQLVAGLPEKEKKAFVDDAINLEKTVAPQRGNDTFLCRFGVQEMRDTLAARRGSPLPEGKHPEGPGLNLGTAHTVTSLPDYEPKYLAPSEWQAKQAEVREKFPAMLGNLTSPSAKP